MTDTPADQPELEGGDTDIAEHDVPTELSELHEILEAQEAGL